MCEVEKLIGLKYKAMNRRVRFTTSDEIQTNCFK